MIAPRGLVLDQELQEEAEQEGGRREARAPPPQSGSVRGPRGLALSPPPSSLPSAFALFRLFAIAAVAVSFAVAVALRGRAAQGRGEIVVSAAAEETLLPLL